MSNEITNSSSRELEQFSPELRFAVNLAYKAGEAIVAKKGGSFTVKDGISNVLTEGDLSSNVVIINGIQDKYPSHSVLSEESTASIDNPLELEDIWVIDPLDGSANFKDGISEVWVSLGYFKAGVGMVGVTHNPFTKVTYVAEKGKGAYVKKDEGQGLFSRIEISNIADLKDSTIETSMSYDPKESRNHNLIKLYLSFIGADVRPREIGSSVGQLCRVAEGVSDLHMHTGLKSWDYAASSVILREAGAVLKRIDGSDFDPLIHRDNISGNEVLVGKLSDAIGQIKGNREFQEYLTKNIEEFNI